MIFATTYQAPTLAYSLSLAGGIVILLVGIVGLAWFGAGGPTWYGFGGWMSGMMGSHGYYPTTTGLYNFFAVLSILSLFSGVIIILGAIMLKTRPQEHMVWGILILVFSIVSLAGMGGYFIGAILGIIGGAYALSYRPRTASAQTPSQ